MVRCLISSGKVVLVGVLKLRPKCPRELSISPNRNNIVRGPRLLSSNRLSIGTNRVMVRQWEWQATSSPFNLSNYLRFVRLNVLVLCRNFVRSSSRNRKCLTCWLTTKNC